MLLERPSFIGQHTHVQVVTTTAVVAVELITGFGASLVEVSGQFFAAHLPTLATVIVMPYYFSERLVRLGKHAIDGLPNTEPEYLFNVNCHIQ
ncbi:hypothetical protein GE09DRAFT_1094447 [Coniochaeta sp. 2T2.1]|nr:hypothetical protein GE09DRAFT_1094447 [Coniochaeta sp. 2T2.1]